MSIRGLFHHRAGR